MNPIFLSALTSHGGPGTAIRTASGTIPAHVHPPADSFPQGTIASVFGIASPEVKPVQVRVASAAPNSSSIGAFFGNLFGSKRAPEGFYTKSQRRFHCRVACRWRR
jgi:hypothetical protein